MTLSNRGAVVGVGVVGRAVTGTLGTTGLVVVVVVVVAGVGFVVVVAGVGFVVVVAGVVGAGVVVSSVLPVGRLVPLGTELSDGSDVPGSLGVVEFEPGAELPGLPPLPGTSSLPGVAGVVVSFGSMMTVTATPSGVVTTDPSGVVTTAERGSRATRSDRRDELWTTNVPTATIKMPAPRVVTMVRRRRTRRTRWSTSW